MVLARRRHDGRRLRRTPGEQRPGRDVGNMRNICNIKFPRPPLLSPDQGLLPPPCVCARLTMPACPLSTLRRHPHERPTHDSESRLVANHYHVGTFTHYSLPTFTGAFTTFPNLPRSGSPVHTGAAILVPASSDGCSGNSAPHPVLVSPQLQQRGCRDGAEPTSAHAQRTGPSGYS